MAGGLEPERCHGDFCCLDNYVREEQDELGPTKRLERRVNGPKLGRERKHR